MDLGIVTTGNDRKARTGRKRRVFTRCALTLIMNYNHVMDIIFPDSDIESCRHVMILLKAPSNPVEMRVPKARRDERA